jgi:formate dehydrogenase maturation protein FdhE
MSKHERVFYKCDRCHAVIDKPYYGGERGTFSLVLGEDYGTCGGALIWKEVCETCNTYLKSLLLQERQFADRARVALEGSEG